MQAALNALVEVEVGDDELVAELGTAGDYLAVGVEDQGVAVEYEFVLAAERR